MYNIKRRKNQSANDKYVICRQYNIGYLLFFRSSIFKIFRNVLCNKRRKEQMGYKTNYSYLYNVICVHVNCGSARDGTILIKKSSGKNENTFYLEDFYFKNIIIIIYSTPQAFFASISAISLYLSPEWPLTFSNCTFTLVLILL